MGILGSVVTAPALGPLKGVLWIVKTIAGQAESELYNEDNIRKELLSLEQQFELGKITSDEYDRLEGELLERLNQARRINEGR